MSDALLDIGGNRIDMNSVYARLSVETQTRIDEQVSSWRESELAGYDNDAVKELGKQVV